jgi:hypothetical protein
MTGSILALLGMILAGTLAMLLFAKAVLWLVLLPFRLLFGLVFGVLLLPLLLVKLVVGLVLVVLVGPIVLIAVVGGLLAAVVGLLIPLFPLLCIAFVVWLLMRSTTAVVA